MPEKKIENLIRGVAEAFMSRDMEKFLSFFAEDGVWVVPEGSFRGKEEIERFLTRLDQVVPDRKSRNTGIGIVVKGNVAVWERVEEAVTSDGRRSEVPGVSVFEFSDDKIQQLRVYVDRLSVAKQAARGWLEKRIINAVVSRIETGLH